MHLRLHPQHAHAPHAHHMPMNMPSTACARHGALYVMVDTWAKVDAHALILALTLTLTLTPNAKSLLPSRTASMATRRSACTAATTTGSSKAARAHSAPRQRQLAASRLESPSRAHTAALPSGLRSRATAAWAPAVHSRRAVAEAPPKGPISLPFYHQVRSRTGQAADDAPR